MTIVVESRPATAQTYISALGSDARTVGSIDLLNRRLDELSGEFAVVLGASVDMEAAVSLAERLRVSHPALSVILLRPRLDTRVLTEALRSGMREVLEERDLTGLSQALRRARVLFERLSGEGNNGEAAHHGKLLTVFSAKGGVGKTTVSSNLAMLLAEGGQRSVCLVDLDLAFGDVAVSLQLLPTHTIADAVPLESGLDAAALQSLLTPYRDGVFTLVAPIQPDAKDNISGQLVARILVLLKEMFDYVVVDTAPAFDDHVLVAFDHSDLLLLLLTLDVPAVKATKVTVETLDLLNYPREKVRLVLNRADSKVGLGIEDVQRALKFNVSATIPSATEVAAAVNRGEPMPVAFPRHPVTDCLRALASLTKEVLESGEVSEVASPPRRHARPRLLFARGGRAT